MKFLIVVALLAVVFVWFVEGCFTGNKGGSGGVQVITIPSGNSNNNNNNNQKVCGVASDDPSMCRVFANLQRMRMYNNNNNTTYALVPNRRCRGIRIGSTGSC